MIIRGEKLEDHTAVRQVNEEAFGSADESDLVDALRKAARPYISLVAEVDGQVVGHIFFSPVQIESEDSVSTALGLGPMAVLPRFQRQRVGSELIRHGLERCRKMGHDVVVVVGHPEYYPRFGFVPASRFGLRCEYDVPDDVFMVREMRDGGLKGVTGTVRYHPVFNRFST